MNEKSEFYPSPYQYAYDIERASIDVIEAQKAGLLKPRRITIKRFQGVRENNLDWLIIHDLSGFTITYANHSNLDLIARLINDNTPGKSISAQHIGSTVLHSPEATYGTPFTICAAILTFDGKFIFRDRGFDYERFRRRGRA